MSPSSKISFVRLDARLFLLQLISTGLPSVSGRFQIECQKTVGDTEEQLLLRLYLRIWRGKREGESIFCAGCGETSLEIGATVINHFFRVFSGAVTLYMTCIVTDFRKIV